jgi:hypothetical protein
MLQITFSFQIINQIFSSFNKQDLLYKLSTIYFLFPLILRCYRYAHYSYTRQTYCFIFIIASNNRTEVSRCDIVQQRQSEKN